MPHKSKGELNEEQWIQVLRKVHPECQAKSDCRITLTAQPQPAGEPAMGYRSHGQAWKISYVLGRNGEDTKENNQLFFVKEYGKGRVESISNQRINVRCEREWKATTFFAQPELYQETETSRSPLVPRMYFFLPERKLLVMECLGEMSYEQYTSTVIGRDYSNLEDDEWKLMKIMFKLFEGRPVQERDIIRDHDAPGTAQYLVGRFLRRGLITRLAPEQLSLTERCKKMFTYTTADPSAPAKLELSAEFQKERTSVVEAGLEAILALHALTRTHREKLGETVPGIPQSNTNSHAMRIRSKLDVILDYENEACPYHRGSYSKEGRKDASATIMSILISQMIALPERNGRMGLVALATKYGNAIHGDCHPLNMMLRPSVHEEHPEVTLIDLSHIQHGYWVSDVIGHLLFSQLFCGLEEKKAAELLERSYKITTQQKKESGLPVEPKETFESAVRLANIEHLFVAACTISGIVLRHDRYGLDEHERISAIKRRTRYLMVLKNALQETDDDKLRSVVLKYLYRFVPEMV